MSNVKKCKSFKLYKYRIKQYFYWRGAGFLLFEFVVTLGIIAIILMATSHLFFTTVHTQRLALIRSQLIADITSYEQTIAGVLDDRLSLHAQFHFERSAHEAWLERWKGKGKLVRRAIQIEGIYHESLPGKAFVLRTRNVKL